jgi:hypothetical protein
MEEGENLESFLSGSDKKIRVVRENLRRIQVMGNRKCFEEVNLLCEETEDLIFSIKKDSLVPESLKQGLSADFNFLVQELEKSQNLESLKKSFSSFPSLENKVIQDSSAEHFRIHQKMRDINEIFKDCSETVKAQGMALDRIDSEIDSSKDFNSKAQFQIEEFSASNQQKKSCCLKFALTSSLLLVFFVLFLFLLKS